MMYISPVSLRTGLLLNGLFYTGRDIGRVLDTGSVVGWAPAKRGRPATSKLLAIEYGCFAFD
jgi:hypothetical protein